MYNSDNDYINQTMMPARIIILSDHMMTFTLLSENTPSLTHIEYIVRMVVICSIIIPKTLSFVGGPRWRTSCQLVTLFVCISQLFYLLASNFRLLAFN